MQRPVGARRLLGTLGACMAWLPMYAAEDDLPQLLSHLNGSEDIAFIVSDGPGKWIAVRSLLALTEGCYCLWHVPSGPLPLFRGATEKPGQITNPFEGWSEVKAGADPSRPYFGAGHPGVFWLNIRSKSTHRFSGGDVGLSSFEWIGNRYKAIGSAPKRETENYWKALGRWVRKVATKVPRGGPQEPTPPEIWAFNGARTLFEAGAKGGNV
jgi:hypothetical protein